MKSPAWNEDKKEKKRELNESFGSVMWSVGLVVGLKLRTTRTEPREGFYNRSLQVNVGVSLPNSNRRHYCLQ